jgi:hypothetical protein
MFYGLGEGAARVFLGKYVGPAALPAPTTQVKVLEMDPAQGSKVETTEGGKNKEGSWASKLKFW